MPRWFNTAGPCRADIHYMLPAIRRVPSLERLIVQQNYAVLYGYTQYCTATAIQL
jgi:hypothetical protein